MRKGKKRFKTVNRNYRAFDSSADRIDGSMPSNNYVKPHIIIILAEKPIMNEIMNLTYPKPLKDLKLKQQKFC